MSLSYRGLCSIQVSETEVKTVGQRPSSQDRQVDRLPVALGTLMSRLSHFLASLRTSVQKERGDRRLENARRLARENEAYIAAGDMAAFEEGIAL